MPRMVSYAVAGLVVFAASIGAADPTAPHPFRLGDNGGTAAPPAPANPPNQLPQFIPAMQGGSPQASAFRAWRQDLPTAAQVRGACDKPSTQEVKDACARYGPRTSYASQTTYQFDLAELLGAESLAFAAYYIDATTVTDALAALGFAQKNAGGGAVGALGAIPGVDLSAFAGNILEGLAKAIEDRAKAEAADFVFQMVRDNICKNAEMKSWLSLTCNLAADGAFGGSSSPGGLSALDLFRQAVQQDMRHLPSSLAQQEVETTAYAALGPATGDLVSAMLAGEPPQRALLGFQRETRSITDPALAPILCAVNAPVAIQAYEPLAVQAQLGPADTGVAVFLLALEDGRCGFIYKDRTTAAQRFGLWTSSWVQLQPLRASLTQAVADGVAVQLQSGASGQDAKTKAKAAAEATTTAVLNALNVAQASLDVAKALGATPADLPQLSAVRNVVEMVQSVWTGDYGQLFTLFLSHVQPSSGSCAVAPCIGAPADLVRYAGLLAAIAGAKTSDDVKDVLLAAADPVDSWKLKWKPGLVITLGGLVGFGAGFSALPVSKNLAPELLVPVGVDVVFGEGLGLFAQVLDLGGYTRYLADGATAPRPLQSISPGILAKWAIPKVPLALFVGGAYDLDSGGVTPFGSWRICGGVAVDATLFVLKRPVPE